MNFDFATTAFLAQMAIDDGPTLDSLSPEEARTAYSELAKRLPAGPESISSETVSVPVDGGS
ncbi:MAG: alpha/beta hydrolase, partial [Pseudomonadota bacterium]|nr:alpha/beta hydrolase [Pseudomonadota bacterium]